MPTETMSSKSCSMVMDGWIPYVTLGALMTVCYHCRTTHVQSGKERTTSALSSLSRSH